MSDHLGLEDLRAFAAGRLDQAQAEAIEAHLQECAACGALFDDVDLSGDDLVGFLRTVPTLQLSPDEAPKVHASLSPASSTGQFGQYTLVREIGRGGMGVVYRAHDPRLRRDVALKIIAPHRDSQPGDRQRFRREAESAARLQHANIVQVFEFGEQDQTLYCAQEFVSGGTLAARLNKSPIARLEAAALVATLADAVEYAHRRQVIHRDLKPSNILFSHDGTPKIADFGLAKILDDDVEQTLAGLPLGSPPYMAPEQAEGALEVVGPKSDVYALGAVLYEALAGRPPFRESTTNATLEKVRKAEPVPPSQWRGPIERDLETICLKCLNKQPAQRYASAADLAADLRRFLAGVPVLARQTGRMERFARTVRRNPGASSLIAGTMLVLFISTVSIALALRASNRRVEAFRRIAYALQLQQAASVAMEHPQQAQQWLYDEEICPEVLRDFTWRWVAARCDLKASDWQNGAPLRSIAAAHRSGTIATGDNSGAVRVWATAGDRRPRVLRATKGPITDLAYDQQDRWLAASSEAGAVAVWNLASLDIQPIVQSVSGRVNGVTFSPTGDWLATAHSGGAVQVWSLPKVEPIQELTGHLESVLRVAVNADGSRMASCSRDGTVRVWSTENWQEEAVLTDPSGIVADVKFHPHQTDLLAFATDRVVHLWSLPGQTPIPLQAGGRGFSRFISSLAFSMDGSSIGAGNYDKTVQVWDVHSREPKTFLRDHSAEIFSVAFDRDNRLLVGAKDGRIQRWRLDRQDKPRRIDAHQGGLTGLAYSAEGAAIVSSGYDGALRVWNSASGAGLSESAVSEGWITLLTQGVHGNRFAWQDSGKIQVGPLGSDHRIRARLVPGDLFQPQAMALSPDGESVLVAESSDVKWLATQSGAVRQTWDQPGVTLVAASQDGGRVAFALANSRLWLGDSASGRGESFACLPSMLSCLAFTPDGRHVGLGDKAGAIAVIDSSSGEVLFNVAGHAGAVLALAFSPDGKTLVTAGEDGEIRFSDPLIGSQRGKFKAGVDVRYLAFAPDSQALACGGDDGVILVWTAPDVAPSPSGLTHSSQRVYSTPVNVNAAQ